MAKTLTVSQFADAAEVSRDTIEREIKKGNIQATRKNPHAGRTSPLLIPVAELTRWKKLRDGKA